MKIAQTERDGQGYPTGGITPTTTLDQANKIIEQAGTTTPKGGNPTAPPPPAMGKVVLDKTGGPAQPPSQTKDRQQQVKDAVADLISSIDGLAVAIFQMKLTDPQIQVLAKKIVNQLSDAVSEITIERVQDLTPDLLGVDEKKVKGGG